MNGEITSKTGLEGLSITFDHSAKPILTVDTQRYQAHLDDTDMTAAQKEEFLQALWQIMVSFVELGFGVHPLQEVCGKDVKAARAPAKGAPDALCSDDPEDDENQNDLGP